MSMRDAWGVSFNGADHASIMEWELGARVTSDLINENTPWGVVTILNRGAKYMNEDDNPQTYLYKYIILDDANTPDPLAFFKAEGICKKGKHAGKLECTRMDEDDDLVWYIPTSIIEHWWTPSTYTYTSGKGASK